jgi:hypothetical protein
MICNSLLCLTASTAFDLIQYTTIDVYSTTTGTAKFIPAGETYLSQQPDSVRYVTQAQLDFVPNAHRQQTPPPLK